jgi:purine-binding chemotaxis protein CheW
MMSVPSITDTRQYLTFQLGEEVFALDVSYVREILEFTTVTRMPGTLGYMRGVINLRGSVVPVLDMKLKFGLPAIEETVSTCIIVTEVSCDGGATVIGALVDSVQEVFELEHDQIEPAPKIGTRIETGFVKGMGKKDDQFVIILDIDRVFSAGELAGIRGVETEEPTQLAVNE